MVWTVWYCLKAALNIRHMTVHDLCHGHTSVQIALICTQNRK